MIKEKLFNALKPVYGKGSKMGLDDEAIDRVATLGATVDMNDEQIAAFVVAAEPLFKDEQSKADRLRTEYSTKIRGLEGEVAELQAKLNGKQPNPTPEPPKQDEVPAWAQTLIDSNNAQKEYIKTLSEELATIKAAKAKEDAVAALDNFVNGWDYAGGFPKERDLAKRVAMKVYKAGGEQMNGEQLIAAFREEFDPAVKDKGVTDFSQPFKGDGGGGTDHKSRFEAMAKRQAERQGAVAAE